MRPILYVAITSHGFGHAVRTAAVVGTLQQMCPDLLPILVTTVPRWLLECYISGDFIQRPRMLDVGVIQSDSLKMDYAATLEKCQEIRSQQRSIIAGEVNFLKTNKVGLVFADIPPLAVPIAKAAGVPCWGMSNFGWDTIYGEWGGEFTEIAEWIRGCYSECDRVFRLPLHEPMSAFPHITDVGLTGGTPRFGVLSMRQKFGLVRPQQKTVLLTFGGLGLQQIPYHNLERFPDWQFITFDRDAPDLPNLLKVPGYDYRPVDFMPLCGRIISKPGYGTFAEALRVGVPIVSLTREDFAEAPYLLEGLQNYSEHQIITPTEFSQGDWDFLRQPLKHPRQPSRLDNQGNETVARAIAEYFQTRP